MTTNILIIICTVCILIALYIFRKTNDGNNQNYDTPVKVELSKNFESTLTNIKNFLEESSKKTDENWKLFKDFDAMMNNRQERGSYHEKKMVTLLKDRLPKEFVSFQETLPNGKVVDALVHFKEEKLTFCIDSKSVFQSFERSTVSRHSFNQLSQCYQGIVQIFDFRKRDLARSIGPL